ncbi:MAG: adenylosuccinate synthase [Phycisphaeraceae bacterium]
MTRSPETSPPATETQPNVLESFGLASGHTTIVGLQWGDEGKGKVVDLFAGASGGFDLVVRYNGGANAGHSVQVGDQRYALHLIPSGILSPDKLNLLGNGVVIDLEQLVKEVKGLKDRGIDVEKNLRVSDRAHLVLPYHKQQDALLEQALAQAAGEQSAIGTTGRGIGPCYADKALRSTAIRVGDLLDEPRLREKLARIVTIKNIQLAALAHSCHEPYEPFDAEELFEQVTAQGRQIREQICDTADLLHRSMSDGKRILFEGANATLLDIDHGTYPFVTSSNCSSLGAHTGSGVPGHAVRHVIGIVKAYQTRVGGGPMPTELHDETGQRIRDRGREYGTTTGRPRRCGWLDLVALKYTTAISGATGLSLMLLDVLAGLEELKVCVAYRYQGRELTSFPASPEVLAEVEPVYETLPGFQEEIDGCRQFSELPDAARRYIERIEAFVGAPVVLASVGPRRDQTVLR